MHRKQKMIPWGCILTGVILTVLAMALLVGISWLASPTYAHASTGYLGPAVSAARSLADDHGDSGTADQVSPWQRVLEHCKQTDCTSHVPAALRRAMGIPAGHAYRVRFGGTTFAWVKMARGRVFTITS